MIQKGVLTKQQYKMLIKARPDIESNKSFAPGIPYRLNSIDIDNLTFIVEFPSVTSGDFFDWRHGLNHACLRMDIYDLRYLIFNIKRYIN